MSEKASEGKREPTSVSQMASDRLEVTHAAYKESVALKAEGADKNQSHDRSSSRHKDTKHSSKGTKRSPSRDRKYKRRHSSDHSDDSSYYRHKHYKHSRKDHRHRRSPPRDDRR